MDKVVKKIKTVWNALGPGVVTGAADDDPSGIATYSQAGAGFGFTFLWLAAWSYPLMGVIQEMCARIALVTGKGLAQNIRTHYSRYWLYICGGLVVFANTLNIGADLGGMADALRIFFPSLSIAVPIIGIALVSVLFEVFASYATYAKYLKWLAFTLLAYVLTGFVVHFDWPALLKAGILPSIDWTRDGLLMIAAVLGTTISPYLFFWQSSEEVEEEIEAGEDTLQKRIKDGPHNIRKMRIDVWGGMFFSNLVMFFIIAVCASTLFPQGIKDITSAASAALALKPLAGDFAEILFALGIISTGLLAIPVLAGSSAYIISEAFEWKEGLYRKPSDAKAFYFMIALSVGFGILFNLIGVNPIKALIYSSVGNAIVSPLALIFIVLLAGDSKVMGVQKSGKLSTFFGWLTILIMSSLTVAIFL